MAKVKSTAREGAVSIRDKHGDLKQSRPLGMEIPLEKIRWMVRVNRLYSRHEHDFSPLYDGSRTLVCSCGAVRSPDGEVY
jgi:hypothetical protein